MMPTSMQCRCCDKLYGPISVDGLGSRWATCPRCGVFYNCDWHDTPAGNIRLDLKEVIADIGKFVPILDALQAEGPLYDVCAYIGTLPYLCRLHGITAIGNEISPAAIAVAKEIFGIDLEFGQFEELGHPSGTYSEIVFHHGIEHVRDPAIAVAHALDLLRNDGKGKMYFSHPVMRDFNDVLTNGLQGHRHEWTFEAFDWFLKRFPNIEILNSGHSEYGPGAGQHWLIRKV